MDALTDSLTVARRPALWRAARPHVATVLILLAAIISAAGLWRTYAGQWRHLHHDVVHDRNAHLEAGLAFADDLTHLRVGQLVRGIDRARTWPPLHDMVLVAAALIPAGGDAKYAVVPGLVSYALAALFAFLLARRLAGTAAGAVAGMFVLVSPAMRAFATDVMLEGPGAAATLAALWCLVRVRQDDAPADWHALAIALSVLFFIKYNYWLLVVFACLPLIGRFGPAFRAADLRPLARHPLTLAAAAVAAFAFALPGFGISPQLAVTACGWLVGLHVTLWLRGPAGRPLLDDPRTGAVIRWHMLPAAVWLAWPGKLSSFLWFLWPGSNVGEFPTTNRWEGVAFYARAAATDYHTSIPAALVVAVLVVLGMALARNLRPGVALVAGFLVIAVALTTPHPNRKSRFVHSWLPAAWVLAGCGVGVVARGRFRAVGVAAAGALIVSQWPGLSAVAAAPEGGVKPGKPSALDLTDAYLPALADATRPAVLSNVPLKFLARWTYQERYGRGPRVATEIPGFDARRVCPENVAAVNAWLASTPSDTIVLVQLPATSPWYVPAPGCAGLEQLEPIFAGQSGWARAGDVAQPGDARVSVWRRARR
jgi:hypothetical protein